MLALHQICQEQINILLLFRQEGFLYEQRLSFKSIWTKIIEYDNQQNQNDVYSTNTKDWQKQILHFSGGTSASEQVLLQGFLNDMAETAEDYYFAER